MTSPAHQQHHDIALLAASAARDRCNGYGALMSPASTAPASTAPASTAPAAAAKAVTDAYIAALASLNPPPAKAPRKTARKGR